MITRLEVQTVEHAANWISHFAATNRVPETKAELEALSVRLARLAAKLGGET